MLKPSEDFKCFSDDDIKLKILKECSLLSDKSKQVDKKFLYKGIYTKEPLECNVIGYAEKELDKKTVVVTGLLLEFDDGRLHIIMPDYLKDMQKGNFTLGNLGESQNSQELTESHTEKSEETKEEAAAPGGNVEQITFF